MFGWFKLERLTKADLTPLQAAIQELQEAVESLKHSVEAAIKTYRCIICGATFARLPGQSDKRCMACQREIKALGSPAITQGNGGHRGAGHNTRGVHKGSKP